MPGYSIQGPGAAFSNTIEDFLLRQAAEKRQAMMDQLAQRREADTHEYHMAAVEEKKRAAQEAASQKASDAHLKRVTGLQIGDIPDSQMLENEEKYPTGLLPDPTKGITDLSKKMPAGGEAQKALEAARVPIRFIGIPKKRDELALQERQEAFIKSQPKGEERTGFEAESVGLKAPARKPNAPTRPVRETATGLAHVNIDGTMEPIIDPATGRQAQGFHQPQINLVNTDAGVMRVGKGGGEATPVTGPGGSPLMPQSPAAVRTRVEQSGKVAALIPDIEEGAAAVDRMGLMGPIGGRWSDFAAGTWGSAQDLAALGYSLTPEQVQTLNEFRSDLGFLKSGTAMVHGGVRGGGSPVIMQRMDSLINASKMDYNGFTGSLRSFKKLLDKYSTYGGQDETPETSTAPDAYQEYLDRNKTKAVPVK